MTDWVFEGRPCFLDLTPPDASKGPPKGPRDFFEADSFCLGGEPVSFEGRSFTPPQRVDAAPSASVVGHVGQERADYCPILGRVDLSIGPEDRRPRPASLSPRNTRNTGLPPRIL